MFRLTGKAMAACLAAFAAIALPCAPAAAQGAPSLLLPAAPSGATPGQNTANIAPKLPAAPAPQGLVTAPNLLAPAAAPSATDSAVNNQILADLKGLVFVAGKEALNPDGLPPSDAGAQGVVAPQLPLLNDPAFVAQMRAHLGKPLRGSDVAQIRDQTRAWYLARNRPFLDVVIPPQNINSGVVQVVVSEYRLGEVEVVGARYFSTKLIKAPLDLRRGQVLTGPQLQANVDRLNENPFISIDAELRPGKDPGSTDLVLRARDRFPVRIYGGYDNQGVPSLDLHEWNVGVNWGNVFGTGQIASYQYTRAFNGRFQSHSVSDVIRLDNEDKLLVFGNYALLKSTAFLGPFRFDSNGHSAQASVRLVRNLPKMFGVTGHVQVGYDYKFTDNNSLFDQVQLGPPSAMETHQIPVVLDATESDRFGTTSLENDLVVSPGRVTARNTDAAFQALVPGSQARYVYDRLSITRTNRLPKDFSLIVRAIVQRSSTVLPNSEQLGGGGVGSVRGYFPDTGLGSNGELVSGELRAPAFSPLRKLGMNHLNDLAQVGLFYDYASIRQPRYVFDGFGNPTAIPLDLASTGFFVHYSLSRYVDLNFDMGFQLRKTPEITQLGSYAAVAVVVSN
jgi:hemolysin activation/secretion protein